MGAEPPPIKGGTRGGLNIPVWKNCAFLDRPIPIKSHRIPLDTRVRMGNLGVRLGKVRLG